VNLRRVFPLFGIFAIASCGGGGGSSSSSVTGQLRFVQASVDAPAVNLVVDGTTLATNLAYSNISDYQSVKTGPRHVQVVPVNSGAAILDTSVSITGGGSQTLLLTGPVAHVQSDLVTDGGTAATTGDGHVQQGHRVSIGRGRQLRGLHDVAWNHHGLTNHWTHKPEHESGPNRGRAGSHFRRIYLHAFDRSMSEKATCSGRTYTSTTEVKSLRPTAS